LGFRYNRRIGGNKGWGWNISGSGVSPSYRSKYGSIGSRGFSIRTGIPGLSFSSGWGSGKNKGAGAAIFLALIGFYVAGVVVYNLARFLVWGVRELYHAFQRFSFRSKVSKP
jgi:hypothetical protein